MKAWHEIAQEVSQAQSRYPHCRPGQAWCIDVMNRTGRPPSHEKEEAVWEEQDYVAVVHLLYNKELP